MTSRVRRPPGTGTIRKRGGAYQALLRFTDSTGRSHQLSATAPTLTLAQAALAQLQIDRLSHTPHLPSARTFGDLATKYREMVETRDPSPASLRRYDDALKPTSWLGSIFPIPLTLLTAEHFDNLYSQMKAAGRAPNTILWTHNFAKSILKQGMRWGWIMTNVADNATNRPRVTRTRITLPDKPSLLRLFEIADNDPIFGMYVRLAAVTGMRRGELCALRRRSLDFPNSQINVWERVVDKGKSPDGRMVVLPGTKTGEPRSIPISPPVVAGLETYLALRDEIAGGHFPDDGFIFSAWEGVEPGNPNTMTARWAVVRKLAGCEGVRLHDLRHLAATTMFAQHLPAHTVARVLGHSKTSTTLNVYGQYVPESGVEAAKVLGELGFS